MWHSWSGPEAHIALEALAYLVGASIYWRQASREPKPHFEHRVLLLGGAVLGAVLGSKLLHVMEHLPTLLARNELALWVGGKSVLGGFLGGTLGVELIKKFIRWTRPTGDPWVAALAVGLIVGRIGCQLSGTWDQTYGTPTVLPWAWDYGDGVGRHPAAIYEIFLVAGAFLATGLPSLRRHPGARFATFLLAYCAMRFGLEWLKPPFGGSAEGSLPVALYSGLTAIQWTALAGITWYVGLLRLRLRSPAVS
ncbi:MAG: prolipoprotein diacylglyceryl transferase family protein [Steroidobacteraceae bacterium]